MVNTQACQVKVNILFLELTSEVDLYHNVPVPTQDSAKMLAMN